MGEKGVGWESLLIPDNRARELAERNHTFAGATFGGLFGDPSQNIPAR